MSVKLGSSLPKDDRNGIGAISAALLDAPEAEHLIIAVVNCKATTQDMDTGDVIPTARILAVEAFEAGSPIGKQVRDVVRRKYNQRTRGDQLPFNEKPDPADDDED